MTRLAVDRIRRTIGILILCASLVLLAGCATCWEFFQVHPMLIVGASVPNGNGTWVVLISVSNMPAGGLSGIAIGPGGLTFSGDVDLASVEIEGTNGFIVTSLDLLDPLPSGCLTVLNPYTGVEAGTILRITFNATGPSPTVTVDDLAVTLLSDLNTFITGWELGLKSYYIK